MSMMTAVSAFTSRTARRGTLVQLVLYSFGLAAVMLLLAGWIVAHAEEPPGGDPTYANQYLGMAVPMLRWSVLALGDVFALLVLGVGLMVVAPAVVVAQVVAERRSGTLDQLRTTPLSPLSLALGLVVGGPARVYLLLVGPLALHLLAGLTGVIAVDTLVATTAALAAGTAASLALGLAAALAPRQDGGGGFVTFGVAILLGAMGFIAFCLPSVREPSAWAFLHPAGALNAAMLEHDGIWRRLFSSTWDWNRFADTDYTGHLTLAPLLSTLCSLAMAGLLGAACCRKLARPHLPLLSKKQALGAFVAVAAALLVPMRASMRTTGHPGALGTAIGILLIGVMTAVTVFAAPSLEAWSLAQRRGTRVGWSSDDASTHGITWLMMATFFGLMVALWPSLGHWRDHEVAALLWCGVLALSVPVLVLFLATRYATPAARWAFGGAAAAHLVAQAIAVVMVLDRERNLSNVYVQVMALTSVVVPLWVLSRQVVLRRKMRAQPRAIAAA